MIMNGSNDTQMNIFAIIPIVHRNSSCLASETYEIEMKSSRIISESETWTGVLENYPRVLQYQYVLFLTFLYILA